MVTKKESEEREKYNETQLEFPPVNEPLIPTPHRRCTRSRFCFFFFLLFGHFPFSLSPHAAFFTAPASGEYLFDVPHAEASGLGGQQRNLDLGPLASFKRALVDSGLLLFTTSSSNNKGNSSSNSNNRTLSLPPYFTDPARSSSSSNYSSSSANNTSPAPSYTEPARCESPLFAALRDKLWPGAAPPSSSADAAAAAALRNSTRATGIVCVFSMF